MKNVPVLTIEEIRNCDPNDLHVSTLKRYLDKNDWDEEKSAIELGHLAAWILMNLLDHNPEICSFYLKQIQKKIHEMESL